MEANDRRSRAFTPPHEPPQPPGRKQISDRHINSPLSAHETYNKDETLSLLRTVKFDHQLRKDEVMGLIEKRVVRRTAAGGFKSGPGNDYAESDFSTATYTNWRDDPFYDIDAYSTDEETQDKKVEDEKEDADASTISTIVPVKMNEEASPLQKKINYPRAQPKIKQTAGLAVLQFSRKTLREAAAPLPNPNTSSFISKPLGATTWSPRHTALTNQTRALPAFSSLVRQSPMESNIATKFDGVISNMMHPIAVPIQTNLDDATPLTEPLRQKIYEFDIDSPLVHENARHIFRNPSDNSVLSIIDTPIKDLRGVFKISVLTPEMSQHAKLPVAGHMMGRGGVNFLAYSAAGRNNVKRHFFTFKFDEDFTTDQEEIEKMEAVEMVKEAFLSHGSKTFRGSVVVNLDATAVGMLEKKLKIDFSGMNPAQKHEFMKQHRVSIVGLLGAENGGKPLFQRAEGFGDDKVWTVDEEEEDDEDDMSRISDLTGPGFNQVLAEFQKNLTNQTNDSTPSSSVVHATASAPSPAVNLAGSTTDSLETPEIQPESVSETNPAEDPLSAADDLANMRKTFVNATPPGPPEDFSAHPFYEGVALSWMAPMEDPMVPLTGYLIQYTKHHQKKPKRASVAPLQKDSVDDATSITSNSAPGDSVASGADEVHEIKILRSQTDPSQGLPTSYKLENMKGGYDYFFRITAFNAVGASQTVSSKKVSPSAIITAKSKDDLPVIFQRFGIDFSKVENVKQSLDELWGRYEKSEFYLEVNQKKELVMHIIRLDIFAQRSLNNNNNDIEVVVETYSQTNDERLREINEVPHKILRKNEPWQRAIRKIAADLFVVDEEDLKLLSFDQKMDKPSSSDVFPGLKVVQHNLRAFVNVQGLPPTSKFHTVQTTNASGITSTIHHYFEWMDIRKYFVQRREAQKLQRKTIYQSGGASEAANNSNIQVDPLGRPLTDEQGYPLSNHDPRRILVEQLVHKLYEGCDSLFYSVLASTNSINCLLQIQIFDKSGIAQDATLCKIGTAKSIAMECMTLDKLDAFCPENVPQREDSKPFMMDSMGGIKLKLSMSEWVESKLKGEAHIDLVSTLGEVLNWESDKRVQQYEAQEEKDRQQSDESDAQDDSDSDSGNEHDDEGIWEKNFEVDDYFSMDHFNRELGSRPFGDAMKVIAEVFGEILAQLSMTTAVEDPFCDLIEDYQIKHLLRSGIITNEGFKVEIKASDRKFIELFHTKINTAQQMPSHVEYYGETPVVGPTPENFHGDSILLDSNAKLWFAGDTGKFIERGHVLSAICKFEVLLVTEHLKLPVTIHDINSAVGAGQIANWLTVSHDVALSIITCRNKLGNFASREDLFDKVKAVSTAAVKQKVNNQLLTDQECKVAIADAAKFTSGLLCWHDLRKTARFADSYHPRMEFLWELICLLRRKLLLYGKGKQLYNSLHHKTGLLSFYLRSSMSTKRSMSQRQSAYNAALQICRVIYPSFTILPRIGGRVKSQFWEQSTFAQRALTEEEFQLELIHYKIDCASQFSNVVDSFRHQTMEVMRHNLSLKTLTDAEKEQMMLLHSEIGTRKVKDQLYGTSKMKHWNVTDETSDEGVNVLLRNLFQNSLTSQHNPARASILGSSAAKLFIIGASKSGKTTLCGKLVIRILASKQIKRDFGIVPLLIPVHKLVMHYAKEVEESDDRADEDLGENKEGEKSDDGDGDGDDVDNGPEKAWEEPGEKDEKKGEYERVDLLDAYFHQECSKFSRRYQALKKLQSEFKLLFIFDGIDEAGPLREYVEGYINDKLKNRNQMVIVTSKQPPLPSNLTLYRWLGTVPLSPAQQLEYAKRKLDHDELGNSRENVFQTAASVLLDPNFSRLSANPLMLSMIVSLMSGTNNSHVSAQSQDTKGQNGRQISFLKGLSLNGLKGAMEDAQNKLLNSLPFKDKPSMFAHATKMTIVHLDINSGLSDNKIDNKTMFKFFQKLAWYCHTNTVVDITNSTMVDLLQATERDFKNENRGTEEEAHHLANTYRHIWNHVTMLVKSHAKKFELMSTTSFQTKLSATSSQTESLYQFAHISFQEYFTAMELLDRLQNAVSGTTSGVEACKQVFQAAGSNNSGQILHNFWWLNVIYFAASAAPSWLYVDICKYLLQNDDDSASNTTLCYELSRLRGENVAVGRPRSVQRLVSCLSSTCVYLRRWALAEIQVNASYKVDIISSLTKALSDDLERSTSTLPWYSKASICNSLVCMDAALYCVGSNRTLHLKIVQVLSKILSDDSESETVKSLVIDSIRSMGLQHEPLVRSTMAKMLGRKERSEIKTLMKMISRMGITDSHVLCVIAGFLNDPDLRLSCEDALVEIVMGQIWQASANPFSAGAGSLEPQSQAARYMSKKKSSQHSAFRNASSGKRTTSFGSVANVAAAANKFRSTHKKRMNVIITNNYLPPPTIHILLQIMALPNSDQARASAARVLGRCNIHDRLIPLFVTWMKNAKGTIPSRTAADLEFPSLTMVNLLSVNFPIEKLLSDSTDKIKKVSLQVQCMEMLECLIHGGQNIGQMLSEENMAETGGILPKMLRCFNATAFPALQLKAIEALQACNLTSWPTVRDNMQSRLKQDEKSTVRGATLAALLKEAEVDKMEVLYSVIAWLKEDDKLMRFDGARECTELKLFSKENIVMLEEALRGVLGDLIEIRTEALRGMLSGGLYGNYLSSDLPGMSRVLLDMVSHDSELSVRSLAAKVMLEGTGIQDKAFEDIIDVLGGWIDNNRTDLYLTCVEIALFLPSEHWNSVNYTASSKFSLVQTHSNITVQSILKLIDASVNIGDVQGAVMDFVRRVGNGGFSLRLLTAMLDGESFSRLLIALEKGDDQLTLKTLHVIDECFIPEQTPLSAPLRARIISLLQLSEDMEIRALCSEITLKFGLDLEPFKRLIDGNNPVLHGCALNAILKNPRVLVERSDLQQVLLNFAPRMASDNLILVFKILKMSELTLWPDEQLNRVRTLLVALMERIKHEFDVLHDNDSDDDDGLMHFEQLSPWCIPCVEVLEKHVFLLSSISQEHLQEETRKMEESINTLTLSEQALLEQRRAKRKSKMGGTQTVVGSKRLVETLQKVVSHPHSDPEVLKMVCSVFAKSISTGEHLPLPALVCAFVECDEPERGVIILNALETIKLTKEGVKPMLKNCLMDAKTRSFLFKPLLKFLSEMRSQEECEWQMPKDWATIIAKGMKEKIVEIAFLMKELRIGGMLSSVGNFAEKQDEAGERMDYNGVTYEPQTLGALIDKFHVEYRDHSSHQNYHERRRSMVVGKKKKKRILNVDSKAGGLGNIYRTITGAILAAEDGDEIHVFPKADGGSYHERLLIDKNVLIKGMKNTFKAEVQRKDGHSPKVTPKSPKRGLQASSADLGAEEEVLGGDGLVEDDKHLSTLDIVEGMVDSMKLQAEEDKAFEKQKELENIAKVKGKKVEKKAVVIELKDTTEDLPVIRTCASKVCLQNITVKHSGHDTFAAIFASFGLLDCQQVKVFSEGGDGIYVTQGAQLSCRTNCHLGPCKRNGVLIEGLCSSGQIADCEIRGNIQCGVKTVSGSSIMMKKNRINSNEGSGVSIGHKCPADLMQNAFEHNGDMHLYVDAPWFPKEKDMINISNVESDDDFRVTSRLNTIKSTKTWSKGRRYSLHGTQNFMDALGGTTGDGGGGGKSPSPAKREVKGGGGGGTGREREGTMSAEEVAAISRGLGLL
ncbi:hypothetical protein TrVE_jg14275 [Triparma verrucosa]|uniref:Fibronectin type-III domain-containing protein n=1 Tax=Triparma verrucosa TaxID=1606542 RepID=A0A9W7F171_9STRA|nr:hypothetical protein TrVE_jg14275 [Triparma verrucosa]